MTARALVVPGSLRDPKTPCSWPSAGGRLWAGGRCGTDVKFGDAEGEVPVPHPVAGEAYLDQARSFQPVRHFQVADVQRVQPEALDERLHARLGLRIVASDEDVERPALLQDMTEDGVECLKHAGAGRGHLGDFLRDRGVLAGSQPVGLGIEGVADVDDGLAREGVSVLGDDRNDTVVQHGHDDDVAGRDGAPLSRRGAAAESLGQVSGLGLIAAVTSTVLPPGTASVPMVRAMFPVPMMLMLLITCAPFLVLGLLPCVVCAAAVQITVVPPSGTSSIPLR